jgi:hypothetical protein
MLPQDPELGVKQEGVVELSHLPRAFSADRKQSSR